MIITILNHNQNIENIDLERVLDKTIKENKIVRENILSNFRCTNSNNTENLKLENEISD